LAHHALRHAVELAGRLAQNLIFLPALSGAMPGKRRLLPRQELHGMDNKSRLPGDVPDELPRELIELGKRIAGLPSGLQHDLEPIYNQVVDSIRRRRRILSLVQDALSQLRLDIKYLMFDLEVTRRERDALRDQLADD
jgi:hypothetical protein